MNLAALGKDNVRTFGECPALAFEGRQLTNVDQQRAANRLANALRRLGAGPGDRVVVMLPNCPEVMQMYAATASPRKPRGRSGTDGSTPGQGAARPGRLPLYSMLGDALRDVLDPRLRGS